MHSGQGHALLSRRIQVQFLTPMSGGSWSSVTHSGSRASHSFLASAGTVMHMTHTHSIHISKIRINIFKLLFLLLIIVLSSGYAIDSTLCILKAIFHLCILAAILYCLNYSCFLSPVSPSEGTPFVFTFFLAVLAFYTSLYKLQNQRATFYKKSCGDIDQQFIKSVQIILEETVTDS